MGWWFDVQEAVRVSWVLRWAAALIIVTLGTAVMRVIARLVRDRLARLASATSNRVDDVVVDVLGRTMVAFWAGLSTLVALLALELPVGFERVARVAIVLVSLLQLGVWGAAAVRHAIDLRVGLASSDPSVRTGAGVLRVAGVVAVWAMVLILALDNLGVDITALVAGLGIGGVAVALATQNILGDLFASVSILLDKPFVVGDFVVVNEFLGTVEHIGVKTTRLRSLSGEQLVFANNDLLQSRLRNFKRMHERRVLFSVGVVYQTPRDKLAEIPVILRRLIAELPDTRFDRSHFSGFGDFALLFETVYYVLSPDYNRYMDLQQQLLLGIHREFARLGIEFAYPTQTLFVQRQPAQANG
jgi:small-conductance mechanosensitive channel